jgi:hypothetical protein
VQHLPQFKLRGDHICALTGDTYEYSNGFASRSPRIRTAIKDLVALIRAEELYVNAVKKSEGASNASKPIGKKRAPSIVKRDHARQAWQLCVQHFEERLQVKPITSKLCNQGVVNSDWTAWRLVAARQQMAAEGDSAGTSEQHKECTCGSDSCKALRSEQWNGESWPEILPLVNYSSNKCTPPGNVAEALVAFATAAFGFAADDTR